MDQLAYFSLFNVVLRHDIKDEELPNIPGIPPHLVFDEFRSKLGHRVTNILKHLFPLDPKPDSKRVISFINENDYISFRHHTYTKPSYKDVELVEIGPRFEMRVYQIKLGTVDIEEADTEWALRPYMNTSRKRDAL